MAQAEDALEWEQGRLAELEAEVSASIAEVDRLTDATQLELETVEMRPRKSDITITVLGLL